MRIDKSEIQKNIVENLVDKNLLKNINQLMDDGIKELKINADNNKISSTDAERLVKFIQESDKFRSSIDEAINKEQAGDSKGGGGFWFGVILVSGLAYGGYEMFLERYSIEEEYSFISKCVGEQGRYYKKEYCIQQLKNCLKENKEINQCSY
ncbi:hypothetical protein [Campylobacter gastrosuis]|uniref:Uncharacterized protein n=1 Tax=Campylobacter gastrosuis TaxID=2974576 RepID=A0ABT7HPU2_9BACT|nr:hypothetical protein [Campylobacter gastrosuis]MDL0088919.1 hypothetical protein [Campylobacter gastrosuis]